MGQHKRLSRVEIKDAARGEVSAVFSTFNVKDSDGDVTLPGAFDDGAPVVVSSYNHSSWGGARPVGKGKIRTTKSEAILDGRFFLDTPDGKDTFTVVKGLAESGLGEWCADEETEILTERGWLRYDEVTTADRAFALNVDSGTATFEDIQAVNIFPQASRQLRLIQTGGFSALTTAAHRWPVRLRDGRLDWRRTDTLKAGDGILRVAPRADTPTDPKWSDAFVELVAWYWTEGHRNRNDGCSQDTAYISQSQRVNPHHVAAIRAACAAAFADAWSEYVNSDVMVRFRFNRDASAALFAVTDEDKTPRADFLLSLTAAQLGLFVGRCMDGDGHARPDGGWRQWYQVSPRAVRMFEMACALAGIPTATHVASDYGNRHGRAPQKVALLRSPVAQPLAAVKTKSYGYKGAPRTPAVDSWVEYEGHVWCPTTPSGTWLARRRGAVYFTGNSYGYDIVEAETGTFDGDDVQFLKKLKVFEVSPVLRGAGVNTRTLAVKSLVDGGLDPRDAARLVERTIVVSEYKAAIRPHETPVTTKAWPGKRVIADLGDHPSIVDLRAVHAWCDPNGDPEAKASYRFAHHDGPGAEANLRACMTHIATLNSGKSGIPDLDRRGVYNHLAGHLQDGDREPPDLRDSTDGAALKFYDETAMVMASVSGLVDRASEVMALRAAKGKSLAATSVDLLEWLYDDLRRLRTVLDSPQDDAAREYVRFVQSMQPRGEQ